MAVPTYSARLIYSANGGSGAPGAQTLSTGMPGEGIAFTISSTRPSRAAYTFKGWSFSSSASSPSYYPGGSVTVSASNTDGGIQSYTLYAVWEHATAYVYYNANGGSGAPSTQSHWAGYSVTLSTTTPTRTGYRFLGWADSDTATSAAYQPGGKYALYYTVTLYAVWERLTYTVSYNANGGSGAPSAQTKTYDVTLTLSSTIPTRSQYEFLGWSTSNTATTATYAAGGSFTTNANTTLYAVWRKVTETYTLTYSANGGSGAPSAESKTAVPPITFTVSSTVPTRSGYNFLGWANSATGAVAYHAGDTLTLSGNKTIYAVWEKAAQTYTLTYNANEGSGAPAAQSKTAVPPISFTVASGTPTRSGYRFLGWADSSSGAVAYHAGDTLSLSGNKTIYAVWEKTYTVTYNVNGGTGTVSSQTKYKDVAITLQGTEPTRTNYTFIGWSTDSGSLYATYQFGDTYSTNADLVLYAVWREMYVISYTAEGGSNVPASQTKMQLVDIELSSQLPVRTGKTFLTWEDTVGTKYSPGAVYTTDADLSLHAVWEDFRLSVNYIMDNGTLKQANAFVIENGIPVPHDVYV